MRSRFTANAVGNGDYLVTTWHPDTCPTGKIRDFPAWFCLEILATEKGKAGDNRGEVEFKAWYRQGNEIGLLHERSRFVRVDDRWRYLDGRIIPSLEKQAGKVGRNSPCPCGSGKKYKRCCLRK
jgi:SEC-C motif-containing protein